MSAIISSCGKYRYLRQPYDRMPYPPPADVIRNLNLEPLYTHPQAEPAGVPMEQQHAFVPRDVSYVMNDWPRRGDQHYVESIVCAKCGRHEDHPTHL